MVRLRLPGRNRFRLSTLLACAAVVILIVVAVGVLTASGSGKAALRTAKPFALSAVGDPAKPVALSQAAGRPVIVNFFASWCTACRTETPLLASFYREHRGQVLVIGVDSNDQSAPAMKFLHEHGVGYPVAFDPSASVAVSYGVAALPQTFFLNARHQIVRHIAGAVTLRELTTWTASLPHQNEAS